ncbi:MAG: hypothetical protein ACREEL_03305 [Stellaceae bacterium]
MATKADKQGHRGVEYQIIEVAANKWKWAFYPKKSADSHVERGEARTRLDAEKACMQAIDAWREKNPE